MKIIIPFLFRLTMHTSKIGGTGVDIGTGIIVDSSGNFYLKGYFTGAASFSINGTPVNSYGSADAFIAKYTSNGVPIWIKNGGGVQFDFSNGLCLNPASNRLSSICEYAPSARFGNMFVTTGNYLVWVYGE